MALGRTQILNSSRDDRTPLPGIAPANQTEAQLLAILDTTVEGIIVIDERGIISTFNRAAHDMFGYPPDEVIGQNISMLMPEPYRSGHDQYMRNYRKTGRAKIIGIGREALGQRKDGTTFPIELAVSEVRVNGKVSFTGLVRDITEQKRLDREILEVSEREQQRIGHDLHDGLCQELAGVAFLAQTMERKLGSAGTVSAQDAAQIRALIQDAVRHARGLSRSLYPVDPQPHGLRVALQQLAADTSDLHKMACEFHSAKAQLHDSRASTHLYRIAQEAVRDAIHHGMARSITIELLAKDGMLIMSVADNGLKLSEDGRYREKMVLRLMKHRARVIGAKLAVNPRSSGGVKIVCEMAISQPPTRAKHG